MRILALIVGTAVAVGLAAAASGDPAADRFQLAQAQESGSQSGSSAQSGLQRGRKPAGRNQQS